MHERALPPNPARLAGMPDIKIFGCSSSSNAGQPEQRLDHPGHSPTEAFSATWAFAGRLQLKLFGSQVGLPRKSLIQGRAPPVHDELRVKPLEMRVVP